MATATLNETTMTVDYVEADEPELNIWVEEVTP